MTRSSTLRFRFLMTAQGSPIGAVDLVIRRNLLTQMILPIHIGNTGHGMLLDTQGTPLICPVLPPTAHLIPHTLLNRLTLDHPLWLVAEDDAHGGRDAIVGAAPIQFSHQLTPSSLGGDRWYAFIRQAPDETYAPIYSLLVTVGSARLRTRARPLRFRISRRLPCRETAHGATA